MIALSLVIDPKGAVQGFAEYDKGADRAKKSSEKVVKSADKVGSAMTNLASLARKAGLTVGAAFAARAFLKTVDDLTLIDNRLRLVTSGTEDFNRVQKELLQISNDTRSSLKANSDMYARLALSTKDLGTSTFDLLAATKTLNQLILLSGANAQEANAGMIQLAQGLASGTLRGDELRSVLEQLPAVADAIAKSMGITRGELREMGQDGKINANIVLRALKEVREETDDKFQKSVRTSGQALTQVGNNAAFMAKSFNEAGNIVGTFNTILDGLGGLLLFAANNSELLMTAIKGVTIAIITSRVASFVVMIRSLGGVAIITARAIGGLTLSVKALRTAILSTTGIGILIAGVALLGDHLLTTKDAAFDVVPALTEAQSAFKLYGDSWNRVVKAQKDADLFGGTEDDIRLIRSQIASLQSAADAVRIPGSLNLLSESIRGGLFTDRGRNFLDSIADSSERLTRGRALQVIAFDMEVLQSDLRDLNEQSKADPFGSLLENITPFSLRVKEVITDLREMTEEAIQSNQPVDAFSGSDSSQKAFIERSKELGIILNGHVFTEKTISEIRAERLSGLQDELLNVPKLEVQYQSLLDTLSSIDRLSPAEQVKQLSQASDIVASIRVLVDPEDADAEFSGDLSAFENKIKNALAQIEDEIEADAAKAAKSFAKTFSEQFNNEIDSSDFGQDLFDKLFDTEGKTGQFTDELQTQISMIGLSTAARQKAVAMIEAQTIAEDLHGDVREKFLAQAEQLLNTQQRLNNEAAASQLVDRLNEEIQIRQLLIEKKIVDAEVQRTLNSAESQGIQLSDEQVALITTRITKIHEMEAAQEALLKKERESQILSQQVEAAFATAFEDAVLGAQSLEDAIEGLIKSLIQLAFRQMVINTLFNAMSFTPGAGNDSGGTDTFLGVGSQSAKGNLFSGTEIVPFAQGGVPRGLIADTAIFPMAGGKVGVAGETNNNEVGVGITRGNNGNLVVDATNLSQPSVNHYHFNMPNLRTTTDMGKTRKQFTNAARASFGNR